MSTENLWGGFQSDEDDSLKVQSYNGPSFGLNQKAVITKFEYSTLTGAGGTEGNPAIIIELKVGENNVNTRIYGLGDKIYYGGKEVTDKNSEDYAKGVKDTIKSIKALITHYLKAVGRTEQEVNTAFSNGITSFADMAKVAQSLVADAITQKKPVDLFMHYQASIKGTADKTYLEIPNSLMFGSFITAHQAPVGEWKEVKEWEEKEEDGLVVKKGLAYVDNSGNYHRFQRDEAYMKGKRATQQTLSGGHAAAPSASTSAQQSEWDN